MSAIEAQLLAHARRIRADGHDHSIAAQSWAAEIVATFGWMDWAPPRRPRTGVRLEVRRTLRTWRLAA